VPGEGAPSGHSAFLIFRDVDAASPNLLNAFVQGANLPQVRVVALLKSGDGTGFNGTGMSSS
jgi:type VI protein secretion system component Hcp